MKKLFFFLSIILLISSSGFAQRKLKKADQLFDKFAYSEAVTIYEEIVLDGKTSDHVVRRLAECYRYIGNSVQAEYWYSLVITQADSKPIDLYYYAMALKSNRKYKDSYKWMGEYAKKENTDSRALREMEEYKKMQKLLKENSIIEIRNLSINSKNADFGTSYISENQVVFASSRDEGKGVKRIYMWDNMPFLELWTAERMKNGNLVNPKKFSQTLNTQYHEGPATFNTNGNLVYFTRNNYFKKKLAKSEENVNNLNIYKAVKLGEEWGNVEPFPYNSKEYSIGHASLSPDGLRLYLSSDMPGGFGGVDIYYCEKLGNEWSRPINMGQSINTEGDEMFPYIHTNGTLYFATSGRTGLGGMDLYYSAPSDSGFHEPQNMGRPLNSSQDDFAFTLSLDGLSGYISSNRDGGVGNDDIYGFTVTDPTKSFNDYDKNGIWTGDEGAEDTTALIADIDKDDDNDGGKNNLGKDEDRIVPFDSANIEDLYVGKTFLLQNIYYDLDKWNIRPDAARDLDKVVAFLKEYPNVKIEMRSHTDCRASDEYNMALSQKRAVSAVMYIVNKGISISRMQANGYGETILSNHCKDGVDCSEELHQLNRRTEIRITEM